MCREAEERRKEGRKSPANTILLWAKEAKGERKELWKKYRRLFRKLSKYDRKKRRALPNPPSDCGLRMGRKQTKEGIKNAKEGGYEGFKGRNERRKGQLESEGLWVQEGKEERKELRGKKSWHSI